jgi:uncharacterized protein YndB with AHSA1/START domain
MTETTAQAARTIAAPADQVWDALTRPEKIKRYFFGADVETDWRIGSPIKFRGEYEGRRFEDRGEIRSFDPGRKLAYTHYSPLSGAPDAPENYHVVTIELEPQGEATEVTLTQSNLTGGVKESDAKMRAEFEKNWNAVLEGLARTVEH